MTRKTKWTTKNNGRYVLKKQWGKVICGTPTRRRPKTPGFIASGAPGRPSAEGSGRGLYRAGQTQLGPVIGRRLNEMEIEKLLRQFYSHYPLHVREVTGNRGEGQ